MVLILKTQTHHHLPESVWFNAEKIFAPLDKFSCSFVVVVLGFELSECLCHLLSALSESSRFISGRILILA